MENNKLLIIDGNSLINRAFYALPLLTNDKGEFSNAVYGFCTMLIKAITELKPTHIAVAFDYGKKTFRHQMFDDYKAGRKETPSELKMQFPILKQVLKSMNICFIEKEGIEADDIIGCISKKTDMETILLSGDKDLFQLIDESTSVWFTKKGITDVEKVTPSNIEDIYGLMANQVVDYKAIRGDTADNIPGINGIGEKGAMQLLKQYGNLDNIYTHIDEIKGAVKEKLINQKEMAYLSQKLATIKTDVEIDVNLDSYKYDFPFNQKTYEIFTEYDFKSIIKRKELFIDSVKVEVEDEIPCEKIVIETKNKLKQVLSYVNDSKQIAFSFSKQISFAFSANILYTINPEITLFDELSPEVVFEEIKSIMSNKTIEKIVYDLKQNKHIFNNEIHGKVFDIAIATYLVAENFKDISCNNYFAYKLQLEKKMQILGVEKLYYEIEMPLQDVLFDMENNGFKINKSELLQLAERLEKQKDETAQTIFDLAGQTFNINSPKQLSEILFDKLQIKTYNNKKKSTGVDILEDIIDQHPIVPYILTYRKLQKMVGGYIEPYKQLVDNNGEIIHTIYNQYLTSTGRLSSSEPNLQNIPVRTEEGRELRKIFVSRFDNGTLISADYSQIELRLLANFSHDPALIEAYNNNEDIHTSTASNIFNIPINDVTSQQRRMAKAVNFGIIYGISDYGLSQNIGTSREMAKNYINTYFEKYPQVKKYMDYNVEQAQKDGYCKTLFGRIRRIPEILSENYNTRNFGMRAAMNMPLQGSASDIIKIAMVNVQNKIKELKLQSKLILTIHDELIVDTFVGEEKIVKSILKDCMENVVNLEVPLLVNISQGKTWAECK